MNRSLNIPVIDEFVWNIVWKVVFESPILKEGFKQEILKSRFATENELTQQLKDLKAKQSRDQKELQKIYKTIGDVETDNLLEKYDEQIYQAIRENFEYELNKKKSVIEQTRIRIKELGNEKK